MPQNIPDDLFKAPDDLFTSNESTKQPIQSTETKQPADRSWFDNIFSAPKFITDITGNVPEGGITDAVKAIPDVASGLWNNPVETIKGGLTGMAQGVASQLSPANVASMAVPYIKPIKAAAPFINAGLGAGQFAKGVTDVMGGDTASGLGNIGFGALGMGTAGLPKLKIGGGGKLANVAESVAGKTPLPESTVLPESVPTPVPEIKPNQQSSFNFPEGPAKTRYDELINKHIDGTITGPELAEARKLDKELRNPKPIPTDKLPESLQGTGKPETVTVTKPTQELINQLHKDGYVASHINDDGYPVMKRDMSQDPINILKAKQAISEMEGSDRVNEIPPEKMTAYAETIDPAYTNRQVSPDEIKKSVPQDDIVKQIENNNADALEIKNAPKDQQESLYRKIMDTQRSLLTGFDVSFLGRQGRGLITHKGYWTALNDMRKSLGSQRAYEVSNQSIIDHPSGYFKPRTEPVISNGKPVIDATTGQPKVKSRPSFAEEIGLDLTDIVKKKEENLRSQWAEKYFPGFKQTSRANTAFINKARSDVLVSLLDELKNRGINPELDLVTSKKIAQSINSSTGRGSFGRLEHPQLNLETKQLEPSIAMKTLNEIFFAPKFMKSRFDMFNRVLNPVNGALAPWSNMDPILRKEALRSLFGVVGTGLLIQELARAAGAQVLNDPTSPDFRKIKIGNTRIDNFAGLGQYGVGTAQFLSGKATSSGEKHYGQVTDLTSGKYGQRTRADIIGNFAANRLAPLPSLIFSWMRGKDFDGKPFEWKKAIANRTAPLVAQDIYDLYQENPALIPASVLPFIGESMQTYAR